MNVYDSAKIAALLEAEGVGAAERVEDADIVVLNTCDIREKAAEKVYSELGTLRAWKAERRAQGAEPALVVAGCVAQAQGAEILRRRAGVDVVVGPQAYHRLPDLLARGALATRPPDETVLTGFETAAKFSGLSALARRHTRPAPVSAFLTVQEGCDKFCTFCVVPYTRGAEMCRSPSSIVEEAERLVASGTREITLLGQNVNAYRATEGGAAWSFARLIARLSAISDLHRIRYTTSHPRDMDDALIAAHGENPKLMPFLHLPVQSGSDRILSRMNRRHTAGHYRAIVSRLRAVRPDMALSTDIIVGFPGETDADFAATCGLVREVGYSSAFTFKYSVRPGTPAADMDDQVPEPVKRERLLELQALVDENRRALAQSEVGAVRAVLFEKPGRHPGQITGRTPGFGGVYVDGPLSLIGTVCPVKLGAAGTNSHSGVILEMEDLALEDSPL